MANKGFNLKVLDDTTVQVTKAFAKAAGYYGTPEFEMWQEIKKRFPQAQMVHKTIKKNPDKRTNRNMTYPNMAAYIREQTDAKDLMAEFQKRIQMSKVQANPYRYVLAWFEKKFENYTDDYQKHFADKAAEQAEKTDIFRLADTPFTVIAGKNAAADDDDMDEASNF